jgi:hypothetical protein
MAEQGKPSAPNVVADGQMSLAEFVTSGVSREVDNGQTKFLAGLETPYLIAGEYGDEILEAAKAKHEPPLCRGRADRTL